MTDNEPGSADDFYYDAQGKKVVLKRAPGYLGVRFTPGKRAVDLARAEPQRRFLRDAETVDFIASYGLQVYRSRVLDRGALKSELRALNASPLVDYATPILQYSSHSSDLVALNNRFIIEFHSEFSADEAEAALSKIAHRYGVHLVERLTYTTSTQGFLLKTPDGDGPMGPIALAQRFFEELPLRYAIPDLVQRRDRHVGTAVRDVPNHSRRETRNAWTFQDSEWHLAAAHVPEAWRDHTLGHSNIVIAISDDGVDIEHPEFEGKLAGQFDFELGIPNGKPKTSINNHGTACAGVAVARGVHTRGVAPNCNLMAVRFPAYMGIADEARMFQWMADNGADVINCSWGPPDGTGAYYPLPDNVASAFDYCVNQGRLGRGVPIIWAAGNGNELVSRDGYASSPNVIAVAACNERDLRSHYSDFGPEIAICAPSSGDQRAGDRRVFTTDRQGQEGYNSGGGTLGGDHDGHYTNDFGGTSSAAPLVAGVVGLMLSVNPELTWRQVKQILMDTADKIGDGYDTNGHSDYFGKGRVNAAKALAGAQSTAPVIAEIAGPGALSPNDPPPRFEITLPHGKYYAVEVATESRLFRAGRDANDRNENNFFATWQHSNFLSASSFHLPLATWNVFKTANKLYYRMWVNGRPDRWENFYATTHSDQSQNAFSIDILHPNEPVVNITTAASHARDAGPPVFSIEKPPGFFYAVELATESRLFHRDHQGDRHADNFFATWMTSNFLSASDYVLPDDIWTRLKSADLLYYRIWVSTAVDAWQDYFTPTPGEKAQSARFFDITGESSSPVLNGPTTLSRTDAPPAFTFLLPKKRFYAMEICTQAQLFNTKQHTSRTPCNFYGSWATEGLKSGTRYTLPPLVWKRLKRAERLYYRLWSSESEHSWKAPSVANSDGVNSPPFILLLD